MKKVSFIGHRDNIFGQKRDILMENIKKEITNQINLGYKDFIVGNHGFFDAIVLSILKSIKDKYISINIEVIINYLYEINKTKRKDEFGYYSVCKLDNVNTIMYNIENEHFLHRITKSNHFMIDESDVLICYVDETKVKSGAKNVFNYAKKKNIKIINLYDEIENYLK